MLWLKQHWPLLTAFGVLFAGVAMSLALTYLSEPGVVIPAQEQVRAWSDRIGEVPQGVSCVRKTSYESFCDVRFASGFVPLRCYTGCGPGCADATPGQCEIRAED